MHSYLNKEMEKITRKKYKELVVRIINEKPPLIPYKDAVREAKEEILRTISTFKRLSTPIHCKTPKQKENMEHNLKNVYMCLDAILDIEKELKND